MWAARRRPGGDAIRATSGRCSLDLRLVSTYSAPAARDHARSGRYVHSRLHQDLPFRAQLDVHSRAEFDHADAVAGGDSVAHLLVEDDAARDQAGDLLEDDPRAVAFDGDGILFVLRGSLLFAGHQELSLM